MTAAAFNNGHIGRSLKHDISRHGIRDDLLQVPEGDLPVDGDDGLRLVMREHLAVIAVGNPFSAPRTETGIDVIDEQVDILSVPAAVDISVQGFEAEHAPQTDPFHELPA